MGNVDFKGYETMVLVCAFRYALGRRTYMPGVIVELILHNWDKLSWEKKKFVDEIKEHERMYGNLVDACDREVWYKIIDRFNEGVMKES